MPRVTSYFGFGVYTRTTAATAAVDVSVALFNPGIVVVPRAFLVNNKVPFLPRNESLVFVSMYINCLLRVGLRVVY